MLDERESYIEEQESQILFPNRKNEQRPNIFNKPTIFLTSRVHCGETPGSFMLQGVLEMLKDLDNS